MSWLSNLFLNEGIAQAAVVYALIIFTGLLLGKIKIFGVSLGATFILFTGIIVGHFGISVNHNVLEFIKEFGLILFVFSIGLQVGPGFFASFKSSGLKLNMLAIGVVSLGVAVTIAFYYILNKQIEMPMLVGIMSGAVTNTPGLGAAQEALRQALEAGQITQITQIGMGYAVAYPLGVVGIILSIIVLRIIFKVNIKKEVEKLEAASEESAELPELFSVCMKNASLDNHTVKEIKDIINRNFVISRLYKDGNFCIPNAETKVKIDDAMLIIASAHDKDAIIAFLGKEVDDINWAASEKNLVSRKILITQSKVNGKSLKQLKLRHLYNVNITRVNRAGIDIVANKNMALQLGDKVTVVGEIENIKKVEKILGNTQKKLEHPNLITLFLGIFVGVIFGSIPFYIPGMPMPVKLGLAGGPLIIAILIGRFGYKFKIVSYTTNSANLMIREIGISLFLASVGLAAGKNFFEIAFSSQGLSWAAIGFAITVIPLLIMGFIGYKYLKINYITLSGALSGSSTDPPALAYSSSLTDSQEPAVAYSTVYPLTMFLRVIAAQLIILFFV